MKDKFFALLGKIIENSSILVAIKKEGKILFNLSTITTLVISGFIMCTGFYYTYIQGYIEDEYPSIIIPSERNTFLNLIGGLILLFSISLFLEKRSAITKRLFSIFVIIVILFNVFAIYQSYSLLKIRLANRECPQLETISSIDMFQEIIDNKEDFIVLIGLENKSSYNDYMAAIINELKLENRQIKYYSTIGDRERNPNKMKSLLNSLGIDRIPVIIKIENGKVTKKLSGDDLTNNLEEVFQ